MAHSEDKVKIKPRLFIYFGTEHVHNVHFILFHFVLLILNK